MSQSANARARAGHGRSAARTYSPHAPRRVSGPVRRAAPAPGARAAEAGAHGRPARLRPGTIAFDVVKGLPDHRWLDKLLRSQAWIWVIGIALGGIVAMQVSLLSMNAGIGRDVQASSDLRHANAKLSEQVAELSGGERIGMLAGEMGLLSPAAGDVGFLDVRPGTDAVRAAQNMTAPSAAARARMAAPATAATPPATTTAPVTTTAAAPAPAAPAAPVATATPGPVTTPVPTPAATAAPVTETPAVTEPVNSTAGAVAAPTG